MSKIIEELTRREDAKRDPHEVMGGKTLRADNASAKAERQTYKAHGATGSATQIDRWHAGAVFAGQGDRKQIHTNAAAEHSKAADAHYKASDAHERAAQHADKIGDDKQFQYHIDKAEDSQQGAAHASMAAEHKDAASGGEFQRVEAST